MKKTSKITIIGLGSVGSQVAFQLVTQSIANNIVLIDKNENKAKGEAIDIDNAGIFLDSLSIRQGDYEESKNSDIIIIAVDANKKEPCKNRIDLLKNNLVIMNDIIPQVAKSSPQGIILPIINPVDIISYFSYKLSKFPKERVIGSGTLLDTSRLNTIVASRFNIDPKSVSGFIIGEHGDSQLPVWSSLYIAGVHIKEYCSKKGIDFDSFKTEVAEEVRKSAYKVSEYKGYTNHAVAISVSRIVKAILKDEHSILPVSTYDEENDVYYSVPTVIGRDGVIERIIPNLDDVEKEKLENSKNILKGYISNFK